MGTAHLGRQAPPNRPGQRARYERRRRQVVAAAARLFAAHGYRGTTIDELVVATGLQRGGLYYYIRSKRHLLLMVHEELMVPLLEQAERIFSRNADPEMQLRDFIRLWVTHVASHLDHMTVFNETRRLLESQSDWDTIRRLRETFQAMLREVLHRGVETGVFTIPDENVTLMSILGAVNHMPLWFSPSGRLQPLEIADEYVDVLLCGIRRNPRFRLTDSAAMRTTEERQRRTP